MDNISESMVLTNNFDEQVHQYFEECSDGTCRCSFCGKVFRGHSRRNDTKRHIETHIEGLSYDCQLCDKTLRSYNALRNHKSKYHN